MRTCVSALDLAEVRRGLVIVAMDRGDPGERVQLRIAIGPE